MSYLRRCTDLNPLLSRSYIWTLSGFGLMVASLAELSSMVSGFSST
jgi:hypothetical protein